MKKTIIIRSIDDDSERLIVEILQDGYNIIDRTVYGITEAATAFLKVLEIDLEQPAQEETKQPLVPHEVHPKR